MNVEDFSFETLKEFDNHKFVSFLYDPTGNLTGFIAVHRGGLLHPAFCATRFLKYNSNFSTFSDTPKLSRTRH